MLAICFYTCYIKIGARSTQFDRQTFVELTQFKFVFNLFVTNVIYYYYYLSTFLTAQRLIKQNGNNSS